MDLERNHPKQPALSVGSLRHRSSTERMVLSRSCRRPRTNHCIVRSMWHSHTIPIRDHQHQEQQHPERRKRMYQTLQVPGHRRSNHSIRGRWGKESIEGLAAYDKTGKRQDRTAKERRRKAQERRRKARKRRGEKRKMASLLRGEKRRKAQERRGEKKKSRIPRDPHRRLRRVQERWTQTEDRPHMLDVQNRKDIPIPKDNHTSCFQRCVPDGKATLWRKCTASGRSRIRKLVVQYTFSGCHF